MFVLREFDVGDVQCELDESCPSAAFEIAVSNEDAIDDDDAVDDAIVVPDPLLLLCGCAATDTKLAGALPSRARNVTFPSDTTKWPCCIVAPGGSCAT